MFENIPNVLAKRVHCFWTMGALAGLTKVAVFVSSFYGKRKRVMECYECFAWNFKVECTLLKTVVEKFLRGFCHTLTVS